MVYKVDTKVEINSSLTTKEKQIANGLKEKNIFIYKGYCYDEETDLYYLNARYYSPIICRFISCDDVSYIDLKSVNGLNLYAYCFNNPVMYTDPSGHLAISTILWSMVLGAAMGAVLGLGSTILKDLKNGELFDGDVTGLTYLGNVVGNAISGAGLGLCTVLGTGLGISMLEGTKFTIGSTVISGGAAFALGVGTAFVTGGLGYIVRAGISDQEEIELSDIAIEATINMANGIQIFKGAMIGGYLGIKHIKLSQSSPKEMILYFLMNIFYGIYFMRALLSYIKKKLKEMI